MFLAVLAESLSSLPHDTLLASAAGLNTDELTETPQDLQVEENREEETYCANLLLSVAENVHITVTCKLP